MTGADPSDVDRDNPFNITKATDFSDEQIRDYWVEWPESGGVALLAKPTSAMPMLILGGKGSGKTHLMRYMSYSLQRLRHRDDLNVLLTAERYLGLYFRCSGLNAARFAGKGQSEHVWESVFSYFMELWFARLALESSLDLLASLPRLDYSDSDLAASILALFDEDLPNPGTLGGILNLVVSLQRDLNLHVNNAAITRRLPVRILASPGQLTFGVPRLLHDSIDYFRSVQYVYLLDELENLNESQQKYVNTLVRERSGPSTFKIGARLYGVRTYSTLNSDEDNKEGSEFERLQLDSYLRQDRSQYRTFAGKLLEKRLAESGFDPAALSSALREFGTSRLHDEEVRFVLGERWDAERPYFERLCQQLSNRPPLHKSDGDSRALGETIVEALRVPGYPLLEKVNVLLLYQAWAHGRDLLAEAEAIAESAANYLADCSVVTMQARILDKFKADLLAQLYRDYDKRPHYVGIGTFVEMSDGIPRNLLTLLKFVYRWAIFKGESPFRGDSISYECQQRGVHDAAEWFFQDARRPGPDGDAIRDAVTRLAVLFREIRFSDKPSECSLSSFSCDRLQLSIEARRTLDAAVSWSMLIPVSHGQRDRNSQRVDEKFQVNGMLAPYWDLPIYRRGAVALSSPELESILVASNDKKYEQNMSVRVRRMTAPYFGTRGDSSDRSTQDQLELGYD